MIDNKVSDKVVWEDGVTPDSSYTPIGQPSFSQPQMMFCYKCNNVIPRDSAFCPYCQIKLFTECPKCGAKCSTQYPACNQCGTNRAEYLSALRKEEERKEKIERERKRQREELEYAQLKREHQKRLDKARDEEAYIAKNKEIMATPEYQSTFSIVEEIFGNAYEKKNKQCELFQKLFFLFGVLPFIPCIIMFFVDEPQASLFVAIGILFIPLISLVIPYNKVYYNRTIYLNECYRKYMSEKRDYDKDMLTQDLIDMVKYQGLDRLSDCCIIAYRKKHNLPINYKLHSLRKSR